MCRRETNLPPFENNDSQRGSCVRSTLKAADGQLPFTTSLIVNMFLPTTIASEIPLPAQLSASKQLRIRQVMQQTLEQARIRYLENTFTEWTRAPVHDLGGHLSSTWSLGANDFTRDVVTHVEKRMQGKRGANFSGVSPRPCSTSDSE